MHSKSIGFFVSQKKTLSQFHLKNFSSKFQDRIEMIFTPHINSGQRDRIIGNFMVTKSFHALLSNCLLWLNRDLSIFLTNKALTNFGNRQERKFNTFFIKNKYETHITGYNYLVKLMGTKLGVKLLIFIVSFLFKIEFYLKYRKFFNNFSVIILSYAARIESEFDFILWVSNYSKQFQLQTLCLQENWDNVFSKKVLFQYPTAFGTWGKQSSDFLKFGHKITSDIYEVGSPRITAAWNIRNDKLSKTKKFILNGPIRGPINKYTYSILLLGTGDAHYDKELCEILLEFKNEFSDQNRKNILVNYRPHPFARKNPKNYWSHTPEGLKIIPSSGGDFDYQLTESILASDLVVTLYSTTVLDSLILDKLVLIPGFIGQNNAIDSINFIHNSWFKGLANYLLLAKSKKQFYSIIYDLTISKNTFINNELISLSRIDSDIIDYYICNKNFYESVEELVQKIESGIDVQKI